MAEVTEKQYLDYAGLSHYDVKIKEYIKKGTDDLAALKTKVEANEAAIAKHDTSIKANETAIGEVSTKVEDISGKLEDVSTQVDKNTSDIASLLNISEALATHIAQNDASFAAIDSRFELVEGSIDKIEEDLTDLSSRIDVIDASLVNVDASLGNHDTRIKALEDYKTGELKTKLDELAAKDTAQDTSIKANTDAIAELQSKTAGKLTVANTNFEYTPDNEEGKSLIFGFSLPDETGKIYLTVDNQKTPAYIDTTDFTKDAFLKGVDVVTNDEGVDVMRFTFNITSTVNGKDVEEVKTIDVDLTKLQAKKASQITVDTAVTNNTFVTWDANALTVDQALSTIAVKSDELKKAIAVEQAAQDAKIAKNTEDIAANTAAIAAFTPISTGDIDKLFI